MGAKGGEERESAGLVMHRWCYRVVVVCCLIDIVLVPALRPHRVIVDSLEHFVIYSMSNDTAIPTHAKAT